MKKVPDNWREEMVNYTTDENHIRLLREGPHSHHEARVLGTLKYRYKKIMGIQDPEPVNCQSNFKEFSEQA
jgi:hypothetical protein